MTYSEASNDHWLHDQLQILCNLIEHFGPPSEHYPKKTMLNFCDTACYSGDNLRRYPDSCHHVHLYKLPSLFLSFIARTGTHTHTHGTRHTGTLARTRACGHVSIFTFILYSNYDTPGKHCNCLVISLKLFGRDNT